MAGFAEEPVKNGGDARVTGSRQGFIICLMAMFVAMGFFSPKVCPAQVNPQMGLLRCVDNDVGISLLCAREWEVKRLPLTVTWVVVDDLEEKVEITVAKSQESGLTYEDLVPSALQYVYGYADGFRFGKKRIYGHKMIAVEGVEAADPLMTILDYFIIKQRDLYRVRFRFSKKDATSRYRPLFIEILKSLRFER